MYGFHALLGATLKTVAEVRLQHYTSLLRSGGVLDPRDACEGRRVRGRTVLRTGEGIDSLRISTSAWTPWNMGAWRRRKL